MVHCSPFSFSYLSERLRGMQDDMADIHNDLNYSDRKLKGIRSFFGVTFKKKKPDEHVLLLFVIRLLIETTREV